MHLLARTVSGLRVELVVRDHSENICIQGHHLRSMRFSLTRLLVVFVVSGGRVAGIDELTINREGGLLSLSQTHPGRCTK